jgi:hypothetical protein
MNNEQIINFLTSVAYQNNIRVTRIKNTITLLDRTNSVQFSITKSELKKNTFHCYFANSDNNYWYTDGINRTIIDDTNFEINTLPSDWDYDDLLILTDNYTYLVNMNTVLSKAMNYFSQYTDALQSFENGFNFHTFKYNTHISQRLTLN